MPCMDMSIRKQLGHKFKELRAEKKKSQKEVADALGLYPTDLSAFENKGEKIGSIEKINALFEHLGYELTPQKKNSTIPLGEVERSEIEDVKRLIYQYEQEQPPIVAENSRQHWKILKEKVSILLKFAEACSDEVHQLNSEEETASEHATSQQESTSNA